MANLGNNMLIALMLIFVLLASQLRSYIQPIIIMLTIPFGIAGAIISHFLLGFDLSFPSIFGMIALSGIVVNDSVVLIDYFNRLKLLKPNGDIDEILLECVRGRLRPILLTTLTTTLGLLPMILETSIQAKFLIPMAASIAGGIFFASMVLVIFVPLMLRLVSK